MRARTLTGMAAVAALALALLAPSAQAVDIIESQEPESPQMGWQAGTCTTDFPIQCSNLTPGQFFTQAAGHPGAGFTQIIVKHEPGLLPGSEDPVGSLKTVLVDLPQGLSVNPQATPQCELENGKFPAGGCKPETKVGESLVTVSVPGLGLPVGPLPFPVFNIAPRPGEPARFGFILNLGNLPLVGAINLGEVFLNAGVAWESDYHEYFTIHVPQAPLGVEILENRLTFNGVTGADEPGGAFLTTPSTCGDPEASSVYSTFLHADSYEEKAPDDEYDVAAPAPPPASFLAGSELNESPLPRVNGGPRARPSGCDQVPFTPTTSANPNTAQTDSPSGATVGVDVPFDPKAPIYQSNVKVARVTLPAGMGINPSAAPTLHTCSAEQFAKGSRDGVSCPANSKIGTVAIDTPVLPDGTLTGNVYLAPQASNDPESGNLYRIFLAPESEARGIKVKLVGNVIANRQTGQLTAVVSEAPQVPFDSVRVTLDGGPQATLTSPPTCGPNRTSHAMTAWSGTPDGGAPDPGFALGSAPGGGACAKTLGERPFSPGFKAAPKSTQAATFTPLIATITRGDGQQELKGVDVTLPPGATAKLAGVPYCPPNAIAAAASRSGAAESKSSSCPQGSQVGVATVSAGSGPSPLQITGKAYLAGRYKGAPLSLVVVTPAQAGPFDLGTVVVRVALFVDAETAQVHAVSDPLPDVFGGAKLSLRSVALNLNRDEFALTGTNCSKFSTQGAVLGGGSDPANSAAFSSVAVSDPVQLENCDALKFGPKLNLRLFGATKRAKHPRLRAILRARGGDANIGRASVALPHALFLDQASLGQICTRVQYAANDCPRKSIYGRAQAETPLLGKPLEGPVYLRSSNNALPDLVAHLEGQVDIDLVGRIDSFRGGIRTTFDRVPDVPVSKFTMTLPGGKHGLLVASKNLCKGKVRAVIQLSAQNGKKANKRAVLRTPCRKKKGKHKGKHGPKRHKQNQHKSPR